LVEDGRIVAEAEGPGANVAALQPRIVERRLRALLADVAAAPIACCAGSAGAEVQAGRQRLERILSALLPDCRITVVHDARLVLAAAGLEAGIARSPTAATGAGGRHAPAAGAGSSATMGAGRGLRARQPAR